VTSTGLEPATFSSGG